MSRYAETYKPPATRQIRADLAALAKGLEVSPHCRKAMQDQKEAERRQRRLDRAFGAEEYEGTDVD